MQILLISLTIASVITTILPYVRSEQWWIRIFDYPRLLIFSIAAGLLLLAVFFPWASPARRLAVSGSLTVVVMLQGMYLLPYAPFSRRQVPAASPEIPDHSAVSILLINVLMDNTNSHDMLSLIRSENPDILCVLEVNERWTEHLEQVAANYPFQVKQPLENTYGISLYSRYEITEHEVKYLVDEEIPSIHGKIALPGGQSFRMHVLHPRPPLPEESTETTERDAELLLLARSLKGIDEPVVVTGDFNDVAWSHTLRLFLKISGLLDPRRGRGMFNSYNARFVLLRWQLDHLFHSDHFQVAGIQRLSACGSDHFPILFRLALGNGDHSSSAANGLTADELSYTEHKIRRGSPLEERPFSDFYPQNLPDQQTDAE